MYLLIFTQCIIAILCLENENYDYNSNGMVVANIKKRDIVPLQQNNRRWLHGNNLSYRKTKDIREEKEEVVDRHFQISEAQLREAQREAHLRDSPVNEIGEDRINSPQMHEGQVRNIMQVRDNDHIRNGDMRENKLPELSEMNYNQNLNYRDKDHRGTINEITENRLWKTKQELFGGKMWNTKEVGNNNMRNAELTRKNIDFNYNPRYPQYNNKGHQETIHEMSWHALDNRNRF